MSAALMRNPSRATMLAMDADLAAGDVLKGCVRLEKRLGSGGFCSVWRGVDLPTKRSVAVKILHREHEQRSGAVERFEQEAELLSRLTHGSIAHAYDDYTRSQPRFFTLEYVRGETLQSRMKKRSVLSRDIPLAGVTWICSQIAGAVAYSHHQGVVHRDLKPANVMVNAPNDRPFVKVLDFGAAKELEGSRFDPTTVGRVVGSIAYMTPEQLRSRKVDGRTDQLALAVMIFEFLTLRRAWAVDEFGQPLPFHEPIGDNNSQLDVMKRIVHGQRPRASQVRPDVPAAVDDVLARAMAIQPSQRFESIEQFREAFYIAMLDASAMAPSWGVDDEIDSGPFDDAGPTASPVLEATLETLVCGVDAPEPEVPSTAELPCLTADGAVARVDADPAREYARRRAKLRRAETAANGPEPTADDHRDAAWEMNLHDDPSTPNSEQGS